MGDTRMSKHNLIMEGWRKFLKENEQQSPKIYLLYKKVNYGHVIILYTVENTSNVFAILETLAEIGSIGIGPTDKPCIPNTQQVLHVHTAPDYAEQGYGTMLYDFAFYVAKELENAGLTSDRDSGTKKRARNKWSSIERNTGKYDDRETEKGNDKFDYDYSTPDDPKDDCEWYGYDDAERATDKSFELKNVSAIESKFQEYEANHMDLMDVLESAGVPPASFGRKLQRMSDVNFELRYDSDGK